VFQERIQEYYETLTPGYRKLADFIVNNTLDAAFLTATELARRVKVDPATVVRFSQEIGYSGYRELSREVKRFVRDQITTTYHAAEGAETEAELLRAILGHTEQQLQRFQVTEVPLLAEAVKALAAASRIWTTGEYADYDLAHYLAKMIFSSIGIPATAFHSNIAETAAAIGQMQPGDVLLALNFGFPGLDTGYAVQIAREKGIHTISITGSGTSLPARLADISIKTSLKSPVTTQTFNLSLMLTSVIWEALASLHNDKSSQTFVDVFDNMGQLIEYRAGTKPYEIPNLNPEA